MGQYQLSISLESGLIPKPQKSFLQQMMTQITGVLLGAVITPSNIS